MRKVILVVATLLIAACGGSNTSNSSTGSLTQAVPPATVKLTTNAKLGQFLVDGSGRTLYLFVADTGATSTCYNDCAKYWPPLLTDGAPQAGTGVNASLLGTTRRNDGSTEVTYAGHPLYYVITDRNPGDATGQAVNNFGAPWYVVAPDGSKISG